MKHFNHWRSSYSSIYSMVKELESDGLIRIKKTLIKGRMNSLLIPVKASEFTYDSFPEENIMHPTVKKLIEKTLGEGKTVYIHTQTGDTIQIS